MSAAGGVPSRTVIELPSFDTGQYEGCEFTMRDDDAFLEIRVLGMPPFSLHFRRARWHQFTALHNCTSEQIEGCYFTLAEISPSDALRTYVANDKAGSKAYRELHHYRIFLDETGCHELFAESVQRANPARESIAQGQ